MSHYTLAAKRGYLAGRSGQLHVAVAVLLSLGVSSLCSGQDKQDNQQKPGAVTLGQVRELVGKQVELIRAGKAEELKQLFTPRLREFITPELLHEAAKHLALVRVEDLVNQIHPMQKKDRHIIVVRQANGRLLTVFVWQHNAWLADTLWFR
ncbi:MAG: hypothetical protein RMJ19_04290 [Gemmatales bacterium]|nr:hypothetical protein [Gemmatales bacterium]MDW8174867.1 hypothetical protein [Gemmatales bacterium]MDW8222726.1 hypothetical protein [Gemmatales bacterium]